MSLSPYTGTWNAATAGHLLRRSCYGPNAEQIRRATSEGMVATLDRLFTPRPAPTPPLNYSDRIDQNAPIGTTWINSPFTGDNTTRAARFRSTQAWVLEDLYREEINIQGRLMTFWHNHFVIDYDTVRDPRYLYTYYETLRRNVLGNFRTFVEEITVDPGMLRYLDGRSNTRRAPNENYARELMELFTLGKGKDAGPGDYTTFTEHDVLELAKVLTGWIDVGYNSQTIGTIDKRFVPNRHDNSDKELSHRFNNTIISNGGEEEYKTLIDIILQREEVATFIARKVYIYFVSTEIDATVESEIIEPLAEIFRTSNYEIAPMVRALLASEHFYLQMEVQGGVISNPLEFLFSMVKTVGIAPDDLTYDEWYPLWFRVFSFLEGLEMQHFFAPNVAGWPAYYLQPQYSELWINSVTIKRRKALIDSLLSPRGLRANMQRVTLDFFGYLEKFEDPLSIRSLIDEMTDLYFTKGLSDEQKDFLVETLLEGLPDFVWTNEYQAYLDDPANQANRTVVVNRMTNLLGLLFILPEFQTI